LSLINDVLKN